jgi:predicted PolB exonuclease-like 3'-5' exonuclease
MITSKKSNKKERFANHRLATSLLKRKTMLPLSGSVGLKIQIKSIQKTKYHSGADLLRLHFRKEDCQLLNVFWH